MNTAVTDPPRRNSPVAVTRAVILQDVFGPFPEALLRQAAEQGIDLSFRPVSTPEEVVEAAAESEVLWIVGGGRMLTPEVLDALPHCRAIIRSGSGVDNIPVEAATKRGIAVYNTPEATAQPVAETTVALILAVHHHVAALDQDTRVGTWGQFNQNYWPSAPLQGRTLGLVGFGEIARRTARLLSGFELDLLVADPFVSPATLEQAGAKAVDLDDLLRTADVVSLHCPLTPKTHHLIGRDQLRLMKPDAILVNTARGGVLDEQALADALREGWIAGAGLDVYETEPLPAGSPLAGLPNLTLLPHLAAHTHQFSTDMRRCGLDVLLTLGRGEHPVSCVNPEVFC